MFAVSQFASKKLKEVRVYPIDQGFGRPIPQRGRPLLAEGEVAQRVIERVKRLSEGYGTKDSGGDGMGSIEV
jgi:poly-gamma-glutamate synthesis protein (capsule biosynthesis protein)